MIRIACELQGLQGAVQGVSSSDGYGDHIGHFVHPDRRDRRLPAGAGRGFRHQENLGPGLFSTADHQPPDIVAHASTLAAMGLYLARKFAFRCRSGRRVRL